MPGSTLESCRLQVEALRRKLLDLSLRNRMLNHRPSKRLGLDVVDGNAAECFRLLVTENRKFAFSGNSVGSVADDGSGERPDDLSDEMSLTDGPTVSPHVPGPTPSPSPAAELHVGELEAGLPAKLRTIQREAKLANDELGVNTLFLTLGLLEWTEAGQRSYLAPLVFVPVALESQANGRIRLTHDGSDAGGNLPLRAKLEELNLKLPDFDDDAPIEQYFGRVADAIAGREGWAVRPNAMYLGFFNYEKYAMYVDLGGDAWPADKKPWTHEDITALLVAGYGSEQETINDSTFLDDVRPLDDSHEVYDADSSQTIAMIRAASGLSIVVEGPPGTGKSQTITNVIAEAAASGKTVLFVAAKRAAVDVVKRRLADAGLGAMCLDLHDKLTKRRDFYAEIKSTLNKAVTIHDEEQRVARLDELRTRLTDHSRAANEPISACGGRITPFSAMVHAARLPREAPEDRDGRIPFEKLSSLTNEQFTAALPAIRALQSRIGDIGVPTGHVFWGTEITYLDPAIRLDLDTDVEAAITAFGTAIEALRKASDTLRIEVPATANDVRVLRLCAERALSAPPLDGVALKPDTWRAALPAVQDVLQALETNIELHRKWQDKVSNSIWTSDLSSVLSAYEKYGEAWYRNLFGDYRTANKVLRQHLSSAGPTDPASQLGLIQDVITAQGCVKHIASHEVTMRQLYGVQWNSIDSDPAVLETLLAWVTKLFADVEHRVLPAGILVFLNGEYSNETVIPAIEAAEDASENALRAYLIVAGLLQFPSSQARAETWGTVLGRLENWKSGLPGLQSFIAFKEARQAIVRLGLECILGVADSWIYAGQRLAEVVQRSYYQGIIRVAMQQRVALRTFDRIAHESAVSEFRALDDFKLEYNRARVRAAHYKQLPTFERATGNLQVLKVQCELQRQHKPIRWIMARSGEAIQRAKPVFMMSPLSVAMHLPPELPPFDIVIFDEASQIKPEDALCSVIRGKQVIVVGDTRQMPPTSFFDKIVDDGDSDDSDEDAAASGLGVETRKLESILSLMSAAVMGRARRPDLRWHYRSLHPSLIQPSNELFYENRLVVFPCAYTDVGGNRVGIVFHHHPDTTYEPGATKRVNRREAEIVAQAIYQHIKANTTESLMAAAMNKPQADLIYDEVSKLERADPAAFTRFREAHPFEPLDIKNLENVQGDERDVVFISVTYGRDASGVVMQRFGPLMAEGGERRLNVLISRSRKRCEVFSNITDDDIRMDRPSLALAALKRYLSYARSGRLEIGIPSGSEEESPFEEEVSQALRQRGYDVHPQIGCEGYRIDLGVIDPKRPGRYILGVECDGVTYHSARTARDRDKLRQRVLEDRGWRLHRIWSPDWWQDRDAEIERLIAALEAAQADSVEETGRARNSAAPIDADVCLNETAREESARPATRRYTETPPPTAMYTDSAVREYVAAVVYHEGPVHHELLITRGRTAAGFGKAGRNVRAWLEGMIDQCVREGRFKRAEDAYYVAGEDLNTPRNWSGRPASERKSRFLTNVELAAAIRIVVGSSFGVEPEEAMRAAYRLLGFSRTTDDALQRARPVLDSLILCGSIVARDGLLKLP